MARTMRVFASAPCFGQDQEVTLTVRICGRTLQHVVLADRDGVHTITITADITATASRYNLITDELNELRCQYEDIYHEPPMKLLVMTWENALNKAWARVLLPEVGNNACVPPVAALRA